MKKVLLISSHYPPSNLTAVHRVRLFANHLPKYGWHPIVLTVHDDFYEEEKDFELLSLIPESQHVEHVSAFPVTKPRIIGDVGLRGFFQLLHSASELIKKEKIDFIILFIPSFYVALLGKILYKRFNVPYGVDYIDPWVHVFPGSERKFSRHWFSTLAAKILEPRALSSVSLLTGVSESYYTPVLQRNPHLIPKVKTLAIPYGWDKSELNVLHKLHKSAHLYQAGHKLRLVYAGAFLPKAHYFLETLFKVVVENPDLFSDITFHFIGTGKLNDAVLEATIEKLSREFQLPGHMVIEYPARLSYFDMLAHIRDSAGVFILGSTESHYSPSKLFNAILLEKPVFAILHEACSVNNLISDSDWGLVCAYNANISHEEFSKDLAMKFKLWKHKTVHNKWTFKKEKVESLSIEQLIKPLADCLNDLHQNTVKAN